MNLVHLCKNPDLLVNFYEFAARGSTFNGKKIIEEIKNPQADLEFIKKAFEDYIFLNSPEHLARVNASLNRAKQESVISHIQKALAPRHDDLRILEQRVKHYKEKYPQGTFGTFYDENGNYFITFEQSQSSPTEYLFSYCIRNNPGLDGLDLINWVYDNYVK
ncbi:MAG: hypothetical protein SFU25_00400 [Candidatus Caenarcaniphilales bacterium]|nr:hypothetical protein [Candidatus Caenarcaniphilales bacterium]